MTRPRGPSARAIVQERRNHKLGWGKAIGELTDNSAGNGARRVLVRFFEKYSAMMKVAVESHPVSSA